MFRLEPRLSPSKSRTRGKDRHGVGERVGGKGGQEEEKETGGLVIGLSKRAPCASSKLRVKRPPWCGVGFLLHS